MLNSLQRTAFVQFKIHLPSAYGFWWTILTAVHIFVYQGCRSKHLYCRIPFISNQQKSICPLTFLSQQKLNDLEWINVRKQCIELNWVWKGSIFAYINNFDQMFAWYKRQFAVSGGLFSTKHDTGFSNSVLDVNGNWWKCDIWFFYLNIAFCFTW